MAEELTSKLENLTFDSTKSKKKERKTLFWAVSIKLEDVMDHEPVKKYLTDHPELIPLKSVHSTLLYVGKKENDKEAVLEPHYKRKCRLTIDAHGCSANAMAMRVIDISFCNDDKSDSVESTSVPSFAVQQHITLALAKGTQAVDSVKTLQGDGTVVVYEKPLIIEGTVHRY